MTTAVRTAPELLAEIGSWFGRDALVAPEYHRAAAEFFGGTSRPWYAPDERERSQAIGRCAEWFAYHRPSEVLGRTPFEHLLASLALSGRAADREAMIRFRGQVYDLFAVQKATDREHVLKAVRSDREYHLGSTHSPGWLRKGSIVLTRIFPWEDGFVLSPVATQFSARDRWVARFRGNHEGLDPLEVERELYIERRHPDRVLLGRERIEAELADFHAAFGLRESVNAVFEALAGCETPIDYLGRQLPRLARKPQFSIYDVNDLGTLWMALWHHTPRPALDGRTAHELHATDPARYQAEIIPLLAWKQA